MAELNEEAGWKTIRPDRTVHFRKLTFGTPRPSLARANLVFLHGLCAASSQFDQVLKELQTKANEKVSDISLNCYVYDAISCGKSPLVEPSDWDAYHTDESVRDLRSILEEHIDDPRLPTILVGHSYGVTVVIRYLDRYSAPGRACNIAGCVFLCSALKGGPVPVEDGGHKIFYLPVFVLRCLQPAMTREFLKRAYYDSADPELLQDAIQKNNANDIAYCQPHHRHVQWATTSEGQSILDEGLSVMVVHGKYDGLMPVIGGRHLADVVKAKQFLIVDQAAHQVMEERPAEVADALLEFLQGVR